MKKAFYLLFAVSLMIATSAYAQSDSPHITKTFTGEKIKDVYCRTSGGGITVEGGHSTARVAVFIKGNNGKNLSPEEIDKRLAEDYKLVIDVSGNKLTATAEPQGRIFKWRDALTISFRIYVPQQVSTDLVTSGGGIDLSNLSGALQFTTSGGGLRLANLSGDVRGRTSGGSIDVSDCKDELDLATSGGGIRASNCSGTLQLTTSGGSVRLDHLTGKIAASTSGGSIHANAIDGELLAHTSGGSVDLKALTCSLDASSSGGNIDIEITKLQQYVTARNSGGNIHVTLGDDKGFDLKLRANRINLHNMRNFEGDKEDDKVDGKVNGGGALIDVRTSGAVTVSLN